MKFHDKIYTSMPTRSCHACADQKKNFIVGSTLKTFFVVFLVDEGKKDPNTTKAGQHWPASEAPFKWSFAGVQMMVQH